MSRTTPTVAGVALRVVALVAALIAAGTLIVVVFDGGGRPVRTTLSVAEALSTGTTGDTAGYARALAPRTFRFPEDHGPHPDFRTEWWYYTGNLSTRTGRRFGYQLTIFRTALTPADETGSTLTASKIQRGRQAAEEKGAEEIGDARQAADQTVDARQVAESSWSTRQLYMGHLALSDVDGEAFFAFERFSRGAAGLAGARVRPYRVWLEDWEVSGTTADSVRLHATEQDISVDLSLQRAKPIVLQGDGGLDRKGPEPGNASYYFSMTRMYTAGTVTLRGAQYAVDGLSWLDREWSTSALSADQVGWDWFSLHLDDGRDVMFYRLRRRDGAASPFSNGVVVARDGAISRLREQDVVLAPIRTWESPVSGSRYPIGWSLRIPSLDVDLILEPYLEQQELNVAVTYWEGAVRVTGSHGGSGFVEMTGYDPATPRGE